MKKHLDLETVFKRLDSANLKVIVDKTNLAQGSILVLSHIFGASGISLNSNIIKRLAFMTRLRNFQEIRQFVGAIKFYRRFILSYFINREGLFELIWKIFAFWGAQQETAF